MAVLKPCARCYRARNFVKDGMGRIFQRPATHTEYKTERGTVIIVDNNTHRITEVSHGLAQYLIGVEVYASKGKLTDVVTGRVVALYNTRRRVHIQTAT